MRPLWRGAGVPWCRATLGVTVTKSTIDPGHLREDEEPAAPAAAVLPPQRDGRTCDLYAPGHLIHYRHQGDAVHSAPQRVRDALVDGTVVTILLESDAELHWRHHDPERLTRVLEMFRTTCRVFPQYHALQAGPYWFNCATESDRWQDCPVSQAALQA